jgi:glycosyltransferase involved in cell wall biosynthesis
MPVLYLPSALKAAREFGPDVIYERGSSYGLGAMIAAILQVPLLTMVLDEHVSGLSLRRADILVATRLDLIPDSYRHKAVRVLWGANTQLFHPGVDGTKMRARLGIASPLLVYAGSFKKWHGLDLLLDALLEPPLLQTHVLLVGDGPLRTRLEARAREMGIASRVEFVGAIPYENVPEFIAAADICVAPFDPYHHSILDCEFTLDPLKIFEYLAMEKPTVTISAANIEALFEDKKHLRLYRAGILGEFVDAVSGLLGDVKSAKIMARAGRKHVLDHYTWDKHAKHLYDLFSMISGDQSNQRGPDGRDLPADHG